jgi:hypothetical protein
MAPVPAQGLATAGIAGTAMNLGTADCWERELADSPPMAWVQGDSNPAITDMPIPPALSPIPMISLSRMTP